LGKKLQYCIYCGEREAKERDHVPPKCFFPEPLPNDLITVPSCSVCNREFGKIDEFVRDVLVSLDTTENRPELASVRAKLHRSMLREESAKLLMKIYTTIRPVDVITKEGIILGKRPAFDFNRVEYDKFFERIARALLYVENSIEYFNGEFKWKMSYDEEGFKKLPFPMKNFLLRGQKKSIGNGLIKYLGLWWKGKPTSLLFINFYEGIEFMIHVKSV
jgi:hypothetical protein